MRARRGRGIGGLLLALALVGCGGPEAREEPESFAADGGAAVEGAARVEAAPSGPVETRLGVGDLDAYERGVLAEMEAVRQAEQRRREARTAEDSLNALHAAAETQTLPAGARAAGMTVDRYREVRREVEGVLRAGATSDFVQQQMAGVDTAGAPPEVRARIRENILEQERQAAATRQRAYAGLSEELVPAFEARAERLNTLRMQLAAERVRVAEGR